mmetsp:Transcript_24133/g.72423  ORF Transcript_24133/g.72423 Transcript_24133/m.72423 type:complete len:128 (+) Transcript_24133:90-473(+)
MLARGAFAARTAARSARRAPALNSWRALSVDGKIPTDVEQQTGRRKAEMDFEAAGQGELYSRDPIVPPPDQGTKENPILVPSAEHERAVGYEDPDVGQLVWFTLTKGPVHYIPDIDLYFKLYDVGEH